MILVDSSGWLEFFTEGPFADQYARALRQPAKVVTPTIVLYEVYKRIKRDRGEEDALVAIAAMHKTRTVPLSEELALTAADLSIEHRLAMADAIILATARQQGAKIVTSDEDFRDIDGVTLFSKKTSPSGEG